MKNQHEDKVDEAIIIPREEEKQNNQKEGSPEIFKDTVEVTSVTSQEKS